MKCTDEHFFVFGLVMEQAMWLCKNCPETLTANQMDRIVERDVSTTKGHIMMIYPALVVLEKGRK